MHEPDCGIQVALPRVSHARGRPFCWRAFTLIEMLTVIAIIGILAGILIPATQMIMKNARLKVAASDIAQLEQAVQSYNLIFGAFPPDSNAPLADTNGGSAGDGDFLAMDTPNECLVWFLTRTYSKAATAAGVPWSGSGWTPSNSLTVFAREACGPFFDVKTKQKRDHDSDGFIEFVDPWGRPYLYRAYTARPIVKIERPSGSISRYFLRPALPDSGAVTITGCGDSDNNGNALTIIGYGYDSGARLAYIDIDRPGGSAENPCPGTLSFGPLHNTQTVDLYSVGPNYKTNAAAKTYSPNYGPLETAAVWGHWDPSRNTCPDGNDVDTQTGNPGIANEKDKDDVNNW